METTLRIRKPAICNRVSLKFDEFRTAVSLNPCPSTALILWRLRFVTLKTYGFKVTQTSHHINIVNCLARFEGMLRDWKIKSRLLHVSFQVCSKHLLLSIVHPLDQMIWFLSINLLITSVLPNSYTTYLNESLVTVIKLKQK